MLVPVAANITTGQSRRPLVSKCATICRLSFVLLHNHRRRRRTHTSSSFTMASDLSKSISSEQGVDDDGHIVTDLARSSNYGRQQFVGTMGNSRQSSNDALGERLFRRRTCWPTNYFDFAPNLQSGMHEKSERHSSWAGNETAWQSSIKGRARLSLSTARFFSLISSLSLSPCSSAAVTRRKYNGRNDATISVPSVRPVPSIS